MTEHSHPHPHPHPHPHASREMDWHNPLFDIPAVDRTRRNHGLEHATITILSQHVRGVSLVGRSTPNGFHLYGNVSTEQLSDAAHEALRRMKAGEVGLAVHPNCGTNLAVGISVVTIGALLGMASSQARTRIATAAASSVAGWAAARPVGEYVQKHFTTLPDLAGVRVTDIARRKFLGITYIEVRTVKE